MHQIKIFDTTLSSSSKVLAYSMDIYEKVKLAMQLEKLGVDIIEIGCASNSKTDYETIKAISKVISNSTICSLANLNKNDIDVAYEALKDANNKRINLLATVSNRQNDIKSKNEYLRQILETVSYAKNKFNDIEFSLEDATSIDLNFACKIIEIAINAGANTINIIDALGYIMPDELVNYIKYIKNKVKNVNNVDISVHCHNDLGNAVSNSLLATKIGINQLECSINGLGQKAGHAALEEIIASLETRKDYFNCYTNIIFDEIYPTSQMVCQITEMPIAYNKPVVGMQCLNSNLVKYGYNENEYVLNKSLNRKEFINFISSMGIDNNSVDFEIIMHKINLLGNNYLTMRKLREIIDDSLMQHKKRIKE